MTSKELPRSMSQDFRVPYNDLLNYVPKNLRNPVISSLIDNLFNRFLTHDESMPLYGYVGQKPSAVDDRTPRVPQTDVERDINSIVPVLSFMVGTERNAFTVQDLIRKAQAIGVSPGNLTWLYSQGNNYLPPIDIDKFTNFFNYYWTAKTIAATPALPWNPELLPEYYTIAAPLPGDLSKLNAVVASTTNTVLTGSGFNTISFTLTFADPTTFTVTPNGSLGAYRPVTSTFILSTNDDHFAYQVAGGPASTVTLVEFDITRDEIFDQYGNSLGLASFSTGDKFEISPQFLTRNYTVTFVGTPGVKGKVAKVKPLNTYQTIDGVALSSGDRVLIKNNSTSDDGIYIVSPGTWSRSADFDGATQVVGARIFVKNGTVNGGHMFESIVGGGGFGFQDVTVPGQQSNTNQWQEGNFWVKGEDLETLGFTRADATQAVRPIIEYAGDIQLNAAVMNGVPSETGDAYRQLKTEFDQLPLFDLFRYDGTHSGLVSSVFYYEEDLTADLDLKLQRRVEVSTNESADFLFNHGMADNDGQLLFVKRNGQMKTIWNVGYIGPTAVDQIFGGTGNGTLSFTPIGFTQQQVWTATATSATTFEIVGSKMPVGLPILNVGIPYTSNEFTAMITAGSVPFVIGDTFIFRIGNLESPRYVYRNSDDAIFDLYGGPSADTDAIGAWQVPRTFYNNPYNEARSPVTEGVLYSHFRGILANQLAGQPMNNAFGGSIKLWSEQQTLLASLLMQRDMTPISMIDLAQRQYDVALNTIRDIYSQRIVQYIGDNGAVNDATSLTELFTYIQTVRADDNDVRTVLFDSTSPVVGFPATLPQLGILPLVQPTLEFDSVLGQFLLTCHDGHKMRLAADDLAFRDSILGNLTTLTILRSDGTYTPAVGSFNDMPLKPYKGELWIDAAGVMRTYNVTSDNIASSYPPVGTFWYKRTADILYRWDGSFWVAQPTTSTPWVVINLANTLNSLMLLTETKLYQGINPNARKYDFTSIRSNPAFMLQLKNELFNYAALNLYDPLGSDYEASNAFTWNYSQTSSLPSMPTGSVPARWYNFLKTHQSTIAGVIPTERPNLEPWKLMGHADYTSWWATLTPTQKTAYTPFKQFSEVNNTMPTAGFVTAVKVSAGITPLFGLPTIDSVSLTTGQMVLLTAETAPQNNGIWIVGSGGWVRPSTPMVMNTYVQVSSGLLYKGSTWILAAAVATPSDPVNFQQVREWTTQLWEDIKVARPGLKLSINEGTDALLPPYVNAIQGWSANALTNFVPAGPSLGYSFGDGSPVEEVWQKSLEFGYSLARALFRFDPLAFLGFCWGFNWVEVDSILYDGFDMNEPGHKRFRLHGETIPLVVRSPMTTIGSGSPLIVTYDAYDSSRKQNFSCRVNGIAIGYVQEGSVSTIGGYTFKIEDEGEPFRIGDRFEISAAGTATFVPTAVYRYLGFGQTFTNALREISVDTTSSYAISAFREWEVNMGYRAGGLVATDDLVVYTDNETLTPSSYDLLFKKNPVARNEWLQALRVSVTQFGAYVGKESGYAPATDGADWTFLIEGYNPRYLGLSYYTLDPLTNPVDFYALSKAHTDIAWLQPTEIISRVDTQLPLTIVGLQNVVTFLFGYSKRLEHQGWEFNKFGGSEFNTDAETGRTRNFQLEIEKLIDRCYAGIQPGQGHVINPFMDRVWFTQDQGLMSEFQDTSLFDITGHPAVFDTLGVKYKVDELNVTRSNQQSSFGASGPMFSAHVQLDEFEHIFIFNDFSQPSTGSGLLYDPFSGGRIVTYKFNGRKQATSTFRPEFGGHFLVDHKVHQNLQASTDNIQNFYDANRAFENDTTTRHALSLLGFNTKKYFDDLDISERTQFNFWRGLIQSKGTNMSVAAYLNNDRFDDAKIDEYWAYKVSEYGDARQRTFPELKLSVNDALTQFTQLQFDNTSMAADGFTTIDRFDESRWFSIDDMDQDASFVSEVVGTYVKPDAVVGQIYTLPFVADWLVSDASYTAINATTIKANATTVTVIGYGPARPKFNPIKLFNYVSNELVQEIPVWHPAAGTYTPTAMECINIISTLNPAKYNYSTQVVNNNSYDPLRPWGTNEVGRVWLDTRNLSYLPYYDQTIFPNRAERLSRWGTLADFATIDVYEWVQSTVPPSQYNALAASQAGDADLDPATKAAGQVADQQTYVRQRNWFTRPIAWSYSPVPVDVDWGGTPPFPAGQTLNSRMFMDPDSFGTISLEDGNFDGVTAGMHFGAWDPTDAAPKPVGEYLIEDRFTRMLIDNSDTTGQTPIAPQPSTLGIPATVSIASTGSSDLSGNLSFSVVPGVSVQHYSEDGLTALPIWDVTSAIQVALNGSVIEQAITFSGLGQTTGAYPNGASYTVNAGQVINIALPVSELLVTVTVITGGVYSADALSKAIASALNVTVSSRNAVGVTKIIANISTVQNPLINDPTDAFDPFIGFNYGWRIWTVPTQAQLDADGKFPTASWKPYVGDWRGTAGTINLVQDAIVYAKNPLTLNNGSVIDRYQTTWLDWSLLKNVVLTATQTGSVTGPVAFTYSDNLDAARTSVYVNGISQLKAAFSITGVNLTVASVAPGSEVTVIIRKYEPTSAELGFNPDVLDNLAYQQQYKQDYEYVSLPTRDSDGSLSATIYFFWVKNKTTPATGKKLSIQSVAQELRDGPTNYLTFQPPSPAVAPYTYDAVTISGLSYIVTKDDTFKLRFTRNFTLRDDPEEYNLKNVHTEWSLMRPGQKTKIPEALWEKLIDSVAGVDAAGNVVPAIRRVLYDERNGTGTQFGFGDEQTLAPSGLLASSIAYTIVNTTLIDDSGSTPVPDYISFLDLDQSASWFATPASARAVMTDIWNQAKVQQINEIFFAALNDVAASNYELADIFKTSRLSAYSIKVVRAAPVKPLYE